MRIAIIGSAGRDKDAANFTSQMFEAMVAHAQKLLDDEKASEICLVSGGSAWSDHVAVALFLRQKAQRLELHLPCVFDITKTRFCYSNIAYTLNRLHHSFSHTAGVDSLGELCDAMCASRCKRLVYKGFYARNMQVAKNVDLMIAFSWSSGDKPLEGGTAYTWNRCQAPRKIHVPLRSLLPTSQSSPVAKPAAGPQ